MNRKKIKRELLRIASQMNSWVMNVYEPYKRWQHQRHRESRLRLQSNPHHHFTGKVAVYLVFQPNGIQPSTWLTLRHLRAKGYSTLLVSNCPMSVIDSESALPECWQIMERPNFGYDFGGYQDGVLHVLGSGLAVNMLLILNDSIWFPLRSDCNLLDRMERCPAGFIGAFQLQPTRDPNKTVGKKRPFMGSFFWHFKTPVLQSQAFQGFWRNYKATSSKFATIRRGERKFTHHLLDAGIVGEAMYSRWQFDEWFDDLSVSELRQALRELCTNDPALAQRQADVLSRASDDSEWEREARAVAMAITEPQNIMATAPLFMVRDMGLPLLKKSADDANVLALRALNRYFSDHPDTIDACVLTELQQVLQRQALA